jgi:hypothetical protein
VESASAPENHMPSTKFIYQRIWSTDHFKVGNHLDFSTLSPKMVMGVPHGDGPKASSSPSERLFYRGEDRLADVKQPTYGEPTDSSKELL